jgi:hypothetical protein
MKVKEIFSKANLKTAQIYREIMKVQIALRKGLNSLLIILIYIQISKMKNSSRSKSKDKRKIMNRKIFILNKEVEKNIVN